jgi:ubiquitin carboxyl-terminal hydrolase 22/27/51
MENRCSWLPRTDRIILSAEHIQELMTAGPEKAEKLINAYAHLNSLLSKQPDVQTAKDPKDPKRVITTTLLPTYLCLQCSAICTEDDRDAHADAKKHRLRKLRPVSSTSTVSQDC